MLSNSTISVTRFAVHSEAWVAPLVSPVASSCGNHYMAIWLLSIVHYIFLFNLWGHVPHFLLLVFPNSGISHFWLTSRNAEGIVFLSEAYMHVFQSTIHWVDEGQSISSPKIPHASSFSALQPDRYLLANWVTVSKYCSLSKNECRVGSSAEIWWFGMVFAFGYLTIILGNFSLYGC